MADIDRTAMRNMIIEMEHITKKASKELTYMYDVELVEAAIELLEYCKIPNSYVSISTSVNKHNNLNINAYLYIGTGTPKLLGLRSISKQIATKYLEDGLHISVRQDGRYDPVKPYIKVVYDMNREIHVEY